MRISLLVQREPFGEILEKTLSAFFTSLYNRPYTVTWTDNCRKSASTGNEQIWLCNPYLNAIFMSDAETKIFEPVLREFSHSTVAWRRPLQKLYCRMATGSATAKWLSNTRIIVSPPLPRASELLIVGGNHRIRLLDRKKGLSYVINKHGFDVSRIKNEILFRRTHTDLPIPPLRETAPDDSWYSEKYIAATPINRLPDTHQAEQFLRQAVKAIQKLSSNTVQEIPLTEYCHKLEQDIRTKITANHLLSTRQKEKLQAQCAAIVRWLDKEKESDSSSLTTAQTHGDFQPGNILANKNRIWLIDWEYTKRRQAAYDGLVYMLRSRFPKGLTERVRQEMQNPDNPILANWPGLNWEKINERKIALTLFLLEELDLYLAENDNKLFYTLSGGMLQFMDELELPWFHSF